MSTDTEINRKAAEWAERILTSGPAQATSSPLSEDELAAFRSWVDASPLHGEAFTGQLILTALSTELRAASSLRNSDWQRFRAPTSIARRQRYKTAPVLLAGVLATAVAIVVVTAVTFMRQDPPSYFDTAAGEMRTVHLADGSDAYLNTRTTIRSRSDNRQRLIELVDGEALFDVRSDPSHPFVVKVSSSEIRVLGTKFVVYRRHDSLHDDVRLSVLNGTVELNSPGVGGVLPWRRQLHANEEITFRLKGIEAEQQGESIQKRSKWLSREIEIENATLSDVVTELSRYTNAPIVLADDRRLPDLRIIATLNVQSVETALNQLEKIIPVRIRREKDTFVLRYRETSPQTGAPSSTSHDQHKHQG